MFSLRKDNYQQPPPEDCVLDEMKTSMVITLENVRLLKGDPQQQEERWDLQCSECLPPTELKSKFKCNFGEIRITVVVLTYISKYLALSAPRILCV